MRNMSFEWSGGQRGSHRVRENRFAHSEYRVAPFVRPLDAIVQHDSLA